MIKDIIIQHTGKATSWNPKPSTSYREYKFISESDLKLLKAWYNSSIMPFKGFSGKVYFSKHTTFPRYKFSEYTRTKNKLVRKVRDVSNADVLVIDTKRYTDILNIQGYTTPNSYIKLIGSSYVNPNTGGLIERDVYSDVSSAGNNVEEGYKFSKGWGNLEEIEFLIECYTNQNNIKICNVQEINTEVNKGYKPINSEVAASYQMLLSSTDPANVKLGMEMMTNSDLEAGLLHIMILCGKNNKNIRYNPYYNSVNYKAFRDKLYNLSGFHFDYLEDSETASIITKFLSMDNKFIQEEDIEYCNKLVKEDIINNYTLEDNGFIIENIDIKLNIDPSKIIQAKSTDVELIEEEEQPVENKLEGVVVDFNS
jgi:hypothetical protein